MAQYKTEENAPAVSTASFRDPSGFVFEYNGRLYRQINDNYRYQYNALIDSGLYEKLTQQGMLIPHEEVDPLVNESSGFFRTIRPEPVAYISYPYEWCFSQLKDAAILTLDIQLTALAHGMCLKDASAYNIQFHKGRPVMIDTLSFEKYMEGAPWVAYRQFCQHFLAPLALMSRVDIRLNKLLLAFIDGIPLDLASTLMPRSSWFKAGLLMHLHLHAITQKKYASSTKPTNGKAQKKRHISRMGYTGIVESLRKTVEKLHWKTGGTEWGAYYDDTNYSEKAFEEKKVFVHQFLLAIQPREVWDLGGNTGVFSRIASEMGVSIISYDVDPAAVEVNYRQVRDGKETLVLPLLLDMTSPSPGLGWNHDERDSFCQRGPTDCIMALALIHHLAISNNVPFEKIAAFFQNLCRYLIIEFVPREDSQVQRLLSSRADIFQTYDRSNFEAIFSEYFRIINVAQIPDSQRTLYLMQAHKK